MAELVPTPTTASGATASGRDGARTTGPPIQDPGPKVLLLMEENSDADQVMGSQDAPYLRGLLDQGATVSQMQAGYPAACPSLPAYLLITSGSTHDICENGAPAEHTLEGPSIFSEVAAAGRQWRVFAEAMDEPCRMTDTPDDRYLVRHTAAPYYASERARCREWQLPMGEPDAGSLSHAIETGLPALTVVVPHRCHDMHGGEVCTGDRVQAGDQWLAAWLPRILQGPDYRSGDLMVILTWDEADSREVNAIPTLVLHPDLAGTTIEDPRDHCSTLRSMSERLGVAPLGCAADAEPLVPAVHG